MDVLNFASNENYLWAIEQILLLKTHFFLVPTAICIYNKCWCESVNSFVFVNCVSNLPPTHSTCYVDASFFNGCSVFVNMCLNLLENILVPSHLFADNLLSVESSASFFLMTPLKCYFNERMKHIIVFFILW